MRELFKLYFGCEIKKNILIIALGLALVIGFKLMFISSYDISYCKEMDRILQGLDGAASIEEEEEIIDRYIAEQYKNLSEAQLGSEERIAEESRISFLHTDLRSFILAQKTSAELIQNAKTGEGIRFSRPSDKYYNDLDAFRKISAPVKVLDQRAWSLYMELQNFSLIPILVMFVVCTVWGKCFEYEVYRSEKTALLGKKYNMIRLLLSYGILVLIQIVFFVFDIAVCGVWQSSDAAIQSVEGFFECTLNTDILGFLIIMELFQLVNVTVCFGVFYLISFLSRDLKKAVSASAFAVMTAYVVKSSYPSALAAVLFGVCDYSAVFNSVF